YVQFPSVERDNDVIAPLWGAQRVGYLLDQIRLHGEEKELVDEATRLARRYGIVTPYTSYLVLEDERRHVAAENQVMEFVPAAPLAAEYGAMRDKAGAPSVQASKEVEGLKNATNAAQMKQGTARMGNVGEQKNIQGRAVYNVSGNWVDSRAQSAKNQTAQRIQFASPEYWSLLDKEPAAREFLALGKNVRFVLKEQVYEVHE